MQLEISLGIIVPNKINPNKMPKGTFDKLKHSILKFGVMNPIIVRKLKTTYEIIDGEWRYRAVKELGYQSLLCKVIEATDEEVAQLIMASTIKGKHNMYATSDIIESLSKTEDENTLKACNLDADKIKRNLKYTGSDKITRIGPAKGRDEKETEGVKPISEYKKLICLADAPKYCKIEDGKVVLK